MHLPVFLHQARLLINFHHHPQPLLMKEGGSVHVPEEEKRARRKAEAENARLMALLEKWQKAR
jgi:hypothetical protein